MPFWRVILGMNFESQRIFKTVKMRGNSQQITKTFGRTTTKPWQISQTSLIQKNLLLGSPWIYVELVVVQPKDLSIRVGVSCWVCSARLTKTTIKVWSFRYDCQREPLMDSPFAVWILTVSSQPLVCVLLWGSLGGLLAPYFGSRERALKLRSQGPLTKVKIGKSGKSHFWGQKMPFWGSLLEPFKFAFWGI